MSGAISLIIVAVVAVFTSITAPLILARRTERIHRADRLADYERQDQVARAAAETSRRLLEQQQAAAGQASDQANRAAAKLDAIDAQAKRIHTLVNSDMTAARQSELDQTRALLAVLRRVLGLSEMRGQEPDPRDLEAFSAAQARADELEQILGDRLHQLREVESEERLHPIGDAQPEGR